MKKKTFEDGSITAKKGFNTENEFVDRMNSDLAYQSKVLKKLVSEINTSPDNFKCFKESGLKHDISIIIDYSGVNYSFYLQCKHIKNIKSSFNQIDKRWIDKYKELWKINSHITNLLKRYTGEIKPTKKTRDPRRIFIDELSSEDKILILKWFDENKNLIVDTILGISQVPSVTHVLIVHQNIQDFKIVDIKTFKDFYNGDVELTKNGNIKIGKIGIQRKGGDGGRPTANMLQFKLSPSDIFNSL